MKIGLVRRGYSGSGGAESYLRRFAAALAAAGHEAILFGSPEWPATAWDGPFVPVTGPTPRDFADRLREMRPRDQCDRLFSLERVWECDAYRAGDGVHRAWLERRRAFEAPWKGWLRARQRKHRELLELEKALFDPASSRVLIANSRMVAREISACFGIPEAAIHVIRNGLAPKATPGNDWAEQRLRTRQALGVAPADWAVLFAGSGWERKGLKFAIEGINEVPGAVLLVAGAGKRRALPRSGQTRFLGEVGEEMDAVLAAADTFLLPTIYDPFSNASLEALAAGLPVITTEANGFAEIMRPGLDGEVLLDPRAGIAQALRKWRDMESPALRQNRREYAAQFSMERNVRETLAAIL